MNAIVVGATGATGKDLLELLLQDVQFRRVDIFVRKDLPLTHEKLHVHVIDFEQPLLWRHLVKGDVLFSCLGTTLKTAGSKEAQWKVDYSYQYEFAKAARQNGVNACVLVSALQASPRSRIFYSRMKGELEEAVKALQFPTLLIFRPPLLIRKNSDRKMEVLGMNVIHFLNRLGLLLSQKPLSTHTLAQAMIQAAKEQRNAVRIVEGQQIRAMVQPVEEK